MKNFEKLVLCMTCDIMIICMNIMNAGVPSWLQYSMEIDRKLAASDIVRGMTKTSKVNQNYNGRAKVFCRNYDSFVTI